MSVASGRRVSVVIISHNSGYTLGHSLDCLGVQTYRDFDVILLDNASRERPDPLVSDRPFPVSYMEMADNLGFAQVMNTAMAATSAPYVVALNPDAYADPGWLAALVAAADTFSAVAALGSLQLSAQDDRDIDGFGDDYLLTGQALAGPHMADGKQLRTYRIIPNTLSASVLQQRSIAPTPFAMRAGSTGAISASMRVSISRFASA